MNRLIAFLSGLIICCASYAQSPVTIGGVKAASPNTIIQRDSSGNAFVNSIVPNYTATVSSGITVTMTILSSQIQVLTGSSAQQNNLPDATTLQTGWYYVFNNNSSQSWTIANNGGSSQYVVPAGGYVWAVLTGVGSANGTWDFHPMPPSTVTWGSGTTGFVMNTVLTTSPTVSAGAASCTSPVFIPQRGALTTGFSGDGSSLCLVVGGANVLQETSSLLTIPIATTIIGTTQINVSNGSATTLIGTGTTTGTVQIGGSATQTVNIATSSSGAKTVTVGSTNASSTLALQGPAGGISLVGTSTGTAADVLCLTSGGVIILQAAGSCTISERKLKDDIRSFDFDPMVEVMRLNPVQFQFKPTTPANPDFNATLPQLGQIAEDVAAVDPRLALYNEDGSPKSYRETAMISLLVAAVQEQQHEIADLKAHLKHRHH